MNDITIFNDKQFGSLRTLEINNKKYLVASDVAKILGYKNVSSAVNRHCKCAIKHYVPDNTGINQFMLIIPESDVLLLIQKSKTKHIDFKNEFKNWLVKQKLISNSFIIESRKEIEFYQILSQGLKPFNLTVETQVIDANYRLDFYIPELNIVIEYDENNHQSYDKNKERERELYIKNKYARLIRVSDKNTNSYNLGLIIKQIYSI